MREPNPTEKRDEHNDKPWSAKTWDQIQQWFQKNFTQSLWFVGG
jgi:hypothetical protein